tara:strand:+ start:261 stop:1298 length:1038 start_codon:yes stop_codon:yes gene_type:complete
MIDLRSDTVTLPTEGMKNAINQAKLGDDVFSEDPTINELEPMAAELMGMESSLLVPSGTMANLVGVLSHCERGDEVILGHLAHTFLYEAGGISAFGGIHSRQLINQADGTLLLPDIKAAIRYANDHFPPTKLICLENTHNLCNGSPLKKDYILSVVEIAKKNFLKVHVDGARIFNASVALGVSPFDLNVGIDSVSFCLSKGLSAPIGSLLCGSKKFIEKARRIRKALGGGMRQGGIVAAAGKYALERMVSRIPEDHRLAKKLSEGLVKINALDLDPNNVKTNIIYFNFESDEYSDQELLDTMKEKGILFLGTSLRRFRMVTHSCVSETDIDYTIKELVSFLGEKQ